MKESMDLERDARLRRGAESQVKRIDDEHLERALQGLSEDFERFQEEINKARTARDIEGLKIAKNRLHEIDAKIGVFLAEQIERDSKK